MLNCYGKNCEREPIAKGLCTKHYARLRRIGSVDNLIRQEYILDGRSKHPLLKTYNGMKHRCLNPKYTYFRLYGGRGIKVCDRWLDPITGFSNFVSDMGEKPSPKHSLDRIDSNGNYEPSNCKWSTPREQASNTSSNNKDVGVKKSGTGWLSYIKVKGEYRSKYFTDYEKAVAYRKLLEKEVLKEVEV